MTDQMNLLIVDDDEGDRRLMEEAIRRSDMQLTIAQASTDKEALQKLESLRPNLIVVLDTILAGVTGFDICRKMREIDQEVKIIICTGMIDAVDAGRARASGADDYCVKTADYDALVATIKNLLKG